MEGKDQTSKEIATCENSVSPRICCEQAAAGMLRAFPVHFVPFQSNSTHCNVHGFTCSYRELHAMWHFIETQFWANYCELSYFKQINLKSVYIYTPKCYTLTVHGSHMLLQIPSYLTQFLTQNHQNST